MRCATPHSRRKVCLFAVVCVWLASVPVLSYASEEAYDELTALCELKGQAYVQDRDRLFKAHPDEWSVKEATAVSWKAGLAAYILNARLQKPEKFAEWDQKEPRSYITGHFFRVNSLAFLVEKIWKGENDRIRGMAHNDFVLSHVTWSTELSPIDLPVELCLGIWRSDVEERLKDVALVGLAQHDEPVGVKIAKSVLQDQNAPLLRRNYVIAALRSVRPKHASKTIIESLPVLLASEKLWVGNALQTIAMAEDAPSRQVLHRLVTDSNLSYKKRGAALRACASNPKASDIEVFRRLLAGEKEGGNRESLVRDLGLFPHRLTAPLLREVLQNKEEEPHVLREAIDSLIEDSMTVLREKKDIAEMRIDQQVLSTLSETYEGPAGPRDRLRRKAAQAVTSLEWQIKWRKEELARATAPAASAPAPVQNPTPH